jgi:hypothetical protein
MDVKHGLNEEEQVMVGWQTAEQLSYTDKLNYALNKFNYLI